MIKLSLKYIATLWGYLNVKIIIGMPKCINVKKSVSSLRRSHIQGVKKAQKYYQLLLNILCVTQFVTSSSTGLQALLCDKLSGYD